MALTIDQLEIQIVAESTQATQTLDALIGRLKTLRNQFNGLGTASKNASKGLQAVSQSADKAEKNSKNFIVRLANGEKPIQKFTDNLARQISKFRTLYGAFKSVANTMGSWFNESNDYIETLNLFNVTMGDGADAAYKYAENVQKLIGIDIAEWMQYQGTFKQLTSGFGVAGDAANTMSQNLTQLSYDMASFFNTDVETAFDKLSSAMSGQVKGLREFGIDTTVASLQEYALAKGIDKSVRSMTQAEKSMLRYNYIMEKSIIIQGDMARTLITPANSLRILSAQLTQLKRAFGNVISVLAVKVIPYVQAFVEIITDAANALANFFGFELPKIDYSGLGGNMSSEFEDAEDSLDGVSDKVKEIKKQLMGFDELNIISNPDTDSSGSSDTGGGALNMDLLEYDFLKGIDTSKLGEIKEKMKDILGYIPVIAAGLAGWKLTSFIADLIFANTKATTLKEALSLLGQKLTLIVGVTLAITGIVLEAKGIKSAIQEELNGVNFTEILGGGGMIVAGGALIGQFLVSGIGAAIGSGIGAIIAGIPMYFTGIYDAIVDGLNWLNGSLITVGATLAGAGIGTLIAPGIGTLIGALTGLVVGGLTDLGVLIYEKWDEITEFFAPAAEWFDTNVIQPIATFFTNLWVGIKETASNCWTSIKEFYTPAVTWFSGLFGSVKQSISDTFYNIGVIASGSWEVIKVAWGKASTWFNENVIIPVKNFFTPMWVGLEESAKKAWVGIKSVFSTVGSFFKTTFTNAWNGVVKVFSVAGDIFVDIKNGVVSAFKTIVNALIKGINKVVSVPFNGINDALKTIKKIKIVGITPFSGLKTISVPQIPLLASGGIVDVGQMFIAREAGPELVGSIGRKTAVANNDQIISGIESGVYRAMVAANAGGNSGGSQTIRIINEIDGDVVGEKVIKYHNGRVMQTGVSPLLV